MLNNVISKEVKLERLESIVQENIRSTIVPNIESDEAFLDFCAKVHGDFLKNDKNASVGLQTVIIDTFSAICLLKDDSKLVKVAKTALSHCASIQEAYGDIYKLNGKEDYVPVREYNGVMHHKDFKLVVINEGIEKTIFDQIPRIDLNNAANLRALLRDLNDCGRMYQELTLDAAKKLYEVNAAFYQEMMRAESTIHMSHNFTKFKDITDDKKFSIYRNNYTMKDSLEVGDTQEFYTQRKKLKKIVVRDGLACIQNTNKKAVEHSANVIGKTAYDDTNLSPTTIAGLDLTGTTGKIAMDLLEAIIKPYNKAVVSKARKLATINSDISLSEYERTVHIMRLDKEHDEFKDKLSNLARFYTKDLSMVEAGRAMFAASNILIDGKKKKAVLKEDTSSTAWMNIAPELGFAYVTASHADIKVCGYKLLGNVSQVAEGDVIEFANGNAIGFDNLYIDDVYDGKLKVQTIDGVVSVVVDINELLEANRIPHTVPDQVSLRIIGGSTIDCYHFAKTKEVRKIASYDDFATQQVFEKAESITLHPVYRYKNGKGKSVIDFNVVVVTIPRKDDPSIKLEIPACNYLCYSNTFENALAGLTFTSVNRQKHTEDSTTWLAVDYGNFKEVERRALASTSSLETGKVNEYDYSSANYIPDSYENAFAPKKDLEAPTLVTLTEEQEMAAAFGANNVKAPNTAGFDEFDYSIFD